MVILNDKKGLRLYKKIEGMKVTPGYWNSCLNWARLNRVQTNNLIYYIENKLSAKHVSYQRNFLLIDYFFLVSRHLASYVRHMWSSF